jgi:hypothetical protein
MMAIFQGTLLSETDSKPVANYNVRFNLKGTIASPGKGKKSGALLVPVSISAQSGPDGRFRASADGSLELKGPVDIIVSAPNGVEVKRQRLDLAKAQEELELHVEVTSPFVVAPSGDPTLGKRLRVSGRVVDERGRPVPTNLPIVIWGVSQTDTSTEPVERPLIVSEIQTNGHFSGEWPTAVLSRAFGRVSGGPPVPVPLDENNRLVRQILLVINLDTIVAAPRSADVACDCEALPPRAPDPADLTTNPGAFSQDLAGGCVDLTMPNRILEEFSYFLVVRTSQPPIKGVTLGVRRRVPKDLVVDLLGVSVASAALGRRASTAIRLPTSDLGLDVRTARDLVRGDRPPTLSQIERAAWLSEVAHAREQIDAGVRESSGRVDLDASHAIDWDDTPTIYLATGLAHGHILRYREVWRADGYSLGDLLYSLPLAPMQRRQVAVVDWDRRADSTREEQLEFEEELDALLTRDRDIQEIVGSNLHEETTANSSNTTWGVSGGIGAGFIGSGFGIFGGVSGGFSGSDTDAHQTASRQFSADSLQRLRDRVAQRSSSVRNERSTVVQTVTQGETLRAETEVVANYNHCHAITVEYFEVLRHFLVTHELADVQECLFVPLPVLEFDRGRALRWREPLTRYLKDRTLSEGFNSLERIADGWVGWDFPEARYSEEAPQSLEGELRISFLLPRPRDDQDGKYQVDMWRPYSAWLPIDTLELFTARLNERAARERDLVFRQEIAPEIAKNLVQGLKFAYVAASGVEISVNLDATLVSRYQESLPLYVTLNPSGALPTVPREDIAHFKIWFEGDPLPPDAQVIVHSGRMRYDSGHMRAFLFNDGRILDDLREGDPVVIPTPVTRAELRNPREEDRELADRLVDHLNKHLEFYTQAIVLSLDAQRRYMLLDAILMPGLDERSVASVCVNEVIGMAGNSLVLPVAPGQRLNKDLQIVDEAGKPVPLENAYTTPPAPPLRVSVPTRGVYAEAVAGECEACEAIDDSRYWRWTTTGQPALPGIETVSTGSRASEEPNLTPTDLPKPLVSIQNAPQVPDPFGLSAAFQLLSKPDLFRDITGLEGSQKNARAAFDAAISAASAVGDEAAKLAVQNEIARNSERMLNRINQAQKDELLTPEVAQELANATLKGFLGEGKTGNGKSGDGETSDGKSGGDKPAGKKAEEKLLDKAAQARTAEIKHSTVDETVEISFDDDAPVVLGSGKGGAFPSTYATPFALDPALDAKLADAIAAATRPGLNSDIPISIVVLKDDGRHLHAGNRHEEMHFSGSMIKIAAMYAAFEMRAGANRVFGTTPPQAKKDAIAELVRVMNPQIDASAAKEIKSLSAASLTKVLQPNYTAAFKLPPPAADKTDFTNTMHGFLTSMIVNGTNTGAGNTIHTVGFGYLTAALIKAGFFKSDPDPSKNKGLWLAGDYLQAGDPGNWTEEGRVKCINDTDTAQGTTTIQLAKMLTLMLGRTLVDGPSSDAMLKFLKDARDHGFKPWIMRSKAGPASFQVTHNKLGEGFLKPANGGNAVMSEASIITQVKNGVTRRFVVVWQNVGDVGPDDDQFGHVARIVKEFLDRV